MSITHDIMFTEQMLGERVARIQAVCQKVNVHALCMKWVDSTGETVTTLETIAFNRIMSAWDPYFDTHDISSGGAPLTGWIVITVFNAMKEHHRFLTTDNVDQLPETEAVPLIPVTMLEGEKTQERADLATLIAREFHASNDAHALDKAVKTVNTIKIAYIKRYGKKEWNTIVHLASKYHPDMSIVDAVKTLCLDTFTTNNLTKEMLTSLHNTLPDKTQKKTKR